MKYFSTGFYVADAVSIEAIFDECFGWIQQSPHTNLIPAQLMYSYDKEDFYTESGGERIDIITCKNDQKNLLLGCFRYSKIDSPHKWITDISVNKNLNTEKVWIQVEATVISQEAAYLATQPKKPLIVMRLIDKFSGGYDDKFQISVEPRMLASIEDDLAIAASVINGDTENKLPVIYISSKYYYNEHPHNLIPERLARKVSGLAHVLVEPEDKIFSNRLKHATNAKNAYGGAAGIYWPKGQSISFYHRGDSTAKDFEETLFQNVLKATTTMAPVSDSGWTEIQNQKIKDSISSLKEKGEYTKELMKLYEDENQSQLDMIEELEHKINSLENRVRTLQALAPTQGSINLNTGDEFDFFEGEIKNIILEAIEAHTSSKISSSRSMHILTSLINNNQQTNLTTERQQQLKRTLTGYRSMDAKTLRQLKEIGFSANDESKHWKLVYSEDPRYTYVLPKTGSDHRGSLNAISDISKIIF